MNQKLLHMAPCSIIHYVLEPSTGEVTILKGKDGRYHTHDLVNLSMLSLYKLCKYSLCSNFPEDTITSDFSHDRSILLSVPLGGGPIYCIKINLL